jgi:hypothetical protein
MPQSLNFCFFKLKEQTQFFCGKTEKRTVRKVSKLDDHELHVLFVLLLLYAHRHRSVLGAAGHIILTPANQLMEE